ncbi:hypothetical protein ABB37_07135 [Leptomonas pyrrhocoris]|uniref:Uncharacterized protein n=1 Tax=Leptomonas pyrrhocoris TaxID=157538 RepID=A0A0N1J4J3_LEPPY|nr:hypothetical protein ABB37_07135 [Leptomonas pyrrhocoris]KPA77228.1 hypothetical protein ABB37_07135 [Leptomonas pyrrhocoris]|eukprot:XP_015655667.1 hypothetical protein ABB37_07135 [Leptomonas pyrrhocoris]
MADKADGAVSVRKNIHGQREAPHHSASSPLSPPPPLRPVPRLISLNYTLVYRFLPIRQQQSQQPAFSTPQGLHHDRSVVELALLAKEQRQCHGSAAAAADALAFSDDVSPAEMHAFYSYPTNTAFFPSPTYLPLAHHPVFVHRCPRLRCHVFDVVCHDKGGEGRARGRSEDENEVVLKRHQLLMEALRLAVTAHTGDAVCAGVHGDDDAKVESRAELDLVRVGEHLHCVVSKLLPLSMLSSRSLGLTMTSSPGAHVRPSSTDPPSAGAASPVNLHWSWVEGPRMEADTNAQGGSSPATFPASRGTPPSSSTALHATRFEYLWHYWTACVDASEGAGDGSEGLRQGAIDEYSVCSDASSVYRRLHAYAQRARRLFFNDVTKRLAATDEQQAAEQLLCALLAVLTEALLQEAYWASPLTPLRLHDPHVLNRYLCVWFTFVGLAVSTSEDVMQIQTQVQAILLTPFASDEDGSSSSGDGMSQSQYAAPMQARLRGVCQWITTKMLSLVVQWMPSTLLTAAPPSPLAIELKETHLLFRSAVAPAQGNSGFTPCLYTLPTLSNGEYGRAAVPSSHTSATHLRGLLDRLWECVAGEGVSPEINSTSQKMKCPRVVAVLSHELFTHTAHHRHHHGVVVCRLHLGASLHSRLVSPPQAARPQSSRLGMCVVRSPVAALLSWYAIDFEDVFRQSYRCWALARRYGVLPSTSASTTIGDNEHSEGARRFQGCSTVDPAIVCYARINAVRAEERTVKDAYVGATNSSSSVVVDSTGTAAAVTPVLGLLGRCLLLGLWMMLKLTDVDLEDGEGDVDVGGTREDDGTSPSVSTRGTLFYSSRRNMLFARDWQTVHQLHHVLRSTSAGIASDTQVPTSQQFTETSTSKAKGRGENEVVRAAATTTLHAFLRARLAQQQTRERHRQVAAAALHRRWQRGHQRRRQQQQFHDERMDSRKLDGAARLTDNVCQRETAPNLANVIGAEEQEDEESCVLLHWSAVEDASVSSIDSSEAASTPAAVPDARASVSSVCTGSLSESATPVRDLAAETSFLVSANDSVVDESVAAPPLSLASASAELLSASTSCSASPELPPPASPSLSLGQRHLFDLEAHERALLRRMALSEVLWLTSLLECVGRRAHEEGEGRDWQELVQQEQGRAQRLQTLQVAQQRSNSANIFFCEVQQLHKDECVPVAALLSAPPAAQTAALEASQLVQFVKMLSSSEERARDALQHSEGRLRSHMHTEHLRCGARIVVSNEEARQRRFLDESWALEQQEWQVRWSTVMLPECVLRDLYRDAFRDEQPTRQSCSPSGSAPAKTTRHVLSNTPTALVSSVAKTPFTPSSRPTSTAQRQVSTVVEAAKAHRAFLLQEEENADDDSKENREKRRPLLQPVLSQPSRRAAPAMSRTRKDSNNSASPLSAHRGRRQQQQSPPPPFSSCRLTPPLLTVGTRPVQTKFSQTKGVPVVSISLCTSEGDDTPLRARDVNQLPDTTEKAPALPNSIVVEKSSRSADFATADLGGTPSRRVDPAVPPPAVAAASSSVAPRGWWYVPLNGGDGGKEEKEKADATCDSAKPGPARCRTSRPCPRGGGSIRHSAPPKMKIARELGSKRSAMLFLKKSVHASLSSGADGAGSRATLTREHKAEAEHDVASAVASAIALARDNGADESSSAGDARAFSYYTQSLHSASEEKEALPDRLPKPRRRRYVTWADDVQEF